MMQIIDEMDGLYEYDDLQDIEDILELNGLDADDCEYIAAIQINPSVIEVSEVGQVFNLPSKSIRTYYIQEGKTGYYSPVGGSRIILIKESDTLHYDLISDLHTIKDADAYLWITTPYEGSDDFQVIQEWYREDTYPNHYKEDNNGES